jgi:hypothetical protein
MKAKMAENEKIRTTIVSWTRMRIPLSMTQYPLSQRSTDSEQDFQECQAL